VRVALIREAAPRSVRTLIPPEQILLLGPVLVPPPRPGRHPVSLTLPPGQIRTTPVATPLRLLRVLP
jgi:hypothetical protein